MFIKVLSVVLVGLFGVHVAYAVSCASLDDCLRKADENLSNNIAIAMDYSKIACNDYGFAPACKSVGVYLIQSKNYDDAFTYGFTACLRDNGEGCYQVGWQYEKGLGISQDYFKASVYYDHACDLGSGDACLNVGAFFSVGKWYTKDLERAQGYFDLACQDNIQKGCDLYDRVTEALEKESNDADE